MVIFWIISTVTIQCNSYFIVNLSPFFFAVLLNGERQFYTTKSGYRCWGVLLCIWKTFYKVFCGSEVASLPQVGQWPAEQTVVVLGCLKKSGGMEWAYQTSATYVIGVQCLIGGVHTVIKTLLWSLPTQGSRVGNTGGALKYRHFRCYCFFLYTFLFSCMYFKHGVSILYL